MRASYVRGEVRRTVANVRYLVFAIGMPVVLLVVLSSAYDDGSTLDGLTIAPYMMVSMATFGAMSAVFATGGRIADERSSGWLRQLRLTSLTGGAYVATKAVTGFVVAVPALAAVFVVAAAAFDVRLSPLRWLLVAAVVLLALSPICALGIWLGYAVRSDSLSAVSGGTYSLLALLGGIWVPLEVFPSSVRTVAELLPMAWITQAGRAAVSGQLVGWHGSAVLAGWTAVLAVLAARAHGRDSARA